MNKLHTFLGSIILTMSILNVSVAHAKPVEDKTVDRLMALSNIKGTLRETNK